MARTRLALVVVVAAAISLTGAVVLTGGASAAPSAVSLVGKWKGQLETPGDRVSFQVSVNKGQRTGTWRTSSTCSGTLRLKNISDGYHHYYRVAGKNRGCAPPGVDCLKRQGAKVLDWFDESNSDISYVGTFRRLK
jgi:hypothetical protein